VRIKVAAIILEPFGVGVLSQLSILYNLLSNFVHLGTVGGITKYTAEFYGKDDKESVGRLIKTVIFIFSITGFIVFIISIIFREELSKILLDDHSYGFLIILIALASSIAAQVEAVSRFFQGMLKIREMTLIGIVGPFIGAIISIALTISFGLKGAVYAILSTAVFSLFLGYWYLYPIALRDIKCKIIPFSPDKNIFVRLYRFGRANIIILGLNTITLLAISTMIIYSLGARSNGFYHVTLTFSTRYLGLIYFAVWRYGFPKIVTVGKNYQLASQMQNDMVRLLFLFTPPMILLLLMFKQFWVSLFYTSAFNDAVSLMGWQFTGDLIRAISWVAFFTLLANEKFKFLIIATLTFSLVRVASFWIFLPLMSIQAAPFSYALSHVFLTPLLLIGNYTYTRFSISRQNWILIIKSFLLLGLTILLTSFASAEDGHKQLILGIALLLFLATSIKRREFLSIIYFFRPLLTLWKS